MKRIIKPICLPFWWQDALITIPRIACGMMLSLDFGAAKFGVPWSPPEKNLGLFEVAFWFPQDVAAYGGIFALMPVFFAWMGAFSEAVGGLLFAAGFCTRFSSFLIICTMCVAAFIQQWGQGSWNMLPSLGFLWVALYHLILGSGRFGLDYLFSKKINHAKN